MLGGFHIVRMEEISDLRQDEKPTSCRKHALQILAYSVNGGEKWSFLTGTLLIFIRKQPLNCTCRWSLSAEWLQLWSWPTPFTSFTFIFSNSSTHPHSTRDFFFVFLFTWSDAILKTSRSDLLPLSEKFSRQNASRAADSHTALASSQCAVGWEQIRSSSEEEMRLSCRRQTIDEGKSWAPFLWFSNYSPVFNFLSVCCCSSCW